MIDDRWRRVKHLFQAAVELPEAERTAFIAASSAGDDALRREVQSLLESDSDPAGSAVFQRLPFTAAGLLPLHVGYRLGAYEIVEPIGSGAMGEVYRARDTRLGRDIALKVVPRLLAHDAASLGRLRREAQVLAALNHPNIAAIHGLDETEGQVALVLELVEGATLAERIALGPLDADEALRIARQIADALAAAHAKGIVHRDLKPANIKITPKGVVKVLDFGLATAAGADALPTAVPMHAGPVAETRDGVIAGTASYMSPEQARGRPVDTRADIWAFGCVLFEMVTGRKPFEADTAAATIARVMAHDAPFGLLSGRTPPGIVRLVSRCLEKDPARRLEDIASARLQIDRVLTRKSRLRKRLAVVAASALAVVALVAAYGLLQQPDAPAPLPTAWARITNVDSSVQPALSPDGRTLAFIRGPATLTSLGEIYIKALPDGAPVQLTSDGYPKMSPTFSPDGERIVYTALIDGSWDTWTVSVDGGKPEPWLKNASGLTWIRRDQLLFSAVTSGNHMAIVTADIRRGAAREVYVPQPVGAMAHRSYASPDGTHVLVVEMDESGAWRPCRLVPLDGSSSGRPLGPADTRCIAAGWSPDGQWMYFTANTGDGFHVWRQRFPDGAFDRLTSGPTEEEGIAIAPDGKSLITSVGVVQRSVWVRDSAGERQISVEGYAYWPLLTADARHVIFRVSRSAATGQTPAELWVADTASGQTVRLLPGRLVTGHDVSHDGRVVASVRDADGRNTLWTLFVDGREPPRRMAGAMGDNPRFGRDGSIYFRRPHAERRGWYRTRADGAAPESIGDVGGMVFGTISPDGRWISSGNGATSLYSTVGEAPVRLFPRTSRLRWSPGGSAAYLSIQYGEASAMAYGRTYVIPVREGSTLPPIPPGGFRSEAEIAAIPGVQALPHGDLAPGATPDTYAFSKTTTTRNLYRIPLGH